MSAADVQGIEWFVVCSTGTRSGKRYGPLLREEADTLAGALDEDGLRCSPHQVVHQSELPMT